MQHNYSALASTEVEVDLLRGNRSTSLLFVFFLFFARKRVDLLLGNRSTSLLVVLFFKVAVSLCHRLKTSGGFFSTSFVDIFQSLFTLCFSRLRAPLAPSGLPAT